MQSNGVVVVVVAEATKEKRMRIGNASRSHALVVVDDVVVVRVSKPAATAPATTATTKPSIPATRPTVIQQGLDPLQHPNGW